MQIKESWQEVLKLVIIPHCLDCEVFGERQEYFVIVSLVPTLLVKRDSLIISIRPKYDVWRGASLVC